MTFDYWTALATSQQIKGCDPMPEMLAAMQALAVERSKARSAERAAKRMTPRFEGPIETLRQPSSISHWGLH